MVDHSEKLQVLEVEHGFHSKIICIDFDGTCVRDEFPKVGGSIGAAPVLRKLVETGHRLILNTVRSDFDNPVTTERDIIAKGGNYLSQALLWCEENGITLWGVNENPEQPTWTYSPKPYAHLYIDDRALGVPLIRPFGEKPYVDWSAAEKLLEREGYFWNGVK